MHELKYRYVSINHDIASLALSIVFYVAVTQSAHISIFVNIFLQACYKIIAIMHVGKL